MTARLAHDMEYWLYIAAGATVGLAIGLTGVGGGSIMTPMLLAFGFPPHIAIGTDLLYAAITKSGGVIAHNAQKSIRWDLVLLLAAGSLPASCLTILALNHWFTYPQQYSHVLTNVLGITLILTSLVIVFKTKLRSKIVKTDALKRFNPKILTPLLGLLLGVMVTLSSVGAGAIATAMLLIFYPTLRSLNVIGTDIAHAVPLTLVAGVGHLFLGNVDFLLLISLLIGSLPAVYFGSKLARLVPEKILQPILATTLFSVGIKVAFF